MEIGASLRKLRDTRKFSSRLIAERIGVSHTTYVDWEYEKSSPSLKNFFKLAEAFEMTPVEMISYLAGGKIVEHPNPNIWSVSEIRKILKDYQEHFDLLRDLTKKQN
jgi:transcriptional regulator with XRE-family HTH domain